MEFTEKVLDKVEGTTEKTIVEGGSVAAGLMLASFVGRTIEGYIKPDVTKTSKTIDKAIAWGANAIPKIGLWYILSEHGREADDKTKNVVVRNAQKATLASVFIDGAIRLSNGGVNTMSAKILGVDILNAGSIQTNNGRTSQISADVQRLIHENSVLRGQLSQSLQKLSNMPVQRQLKTPPVYAQPTYTTPVQAQQPVYTAPVQTTQPIYTASMQTQQPVHIDQAPHVHIAPMQTAQPSPVVTVMPVTPMQMAQPSPVVTVMPVTDVPPLDHNRRFGMMDAASDAEERRRRFGIMDKPMFGFVGEGEDRRREFGAMIPTDNGEERRREYSAMDKPMFGFVGEGKDRRKKYSAMEPGTSPIHERERKFGFMNNAKLNSIGNDDSIAYQFGML